MVDDITILIDFLFAYTLIIIGTVFSLLKKHNINI